MSNDKPKTKSEILDELDRLKELLEKDRFDTSDDDIPMLDEVVEIGDEVIPVLDEVAVLPTSAPQETAPAPSGKALPTQQELNKLIDMLVGHQLRKLRPIIQKEVMKLVLERYPDLK